jgi:hypothetical protein
VEARNKFAPYRLYCAAPIAIALGHSPVVRLVWKVPLVLREGNYGPLERWRNAGAMMILDAGITHLGGV